ncbi:hypothetical protein IFT35_14875 [Pantoea agglomerans]|uniref:hypothetical protein n=1 Tax=Enterobacter agglomerans TaxID=549 RepID=UPI00177E3DAF|nr:hypothetical protein [Pantoea agglomerans]MBD8198201.1 hypothetical protein [Pantoea agglomerans]
MRRFVFFILFFMTGCTYPTSSSSTEITNKIPASESGSAQAKENRSFEEFYDGIRNIFQVKQDANMKEIYNLKLQLIALQNSINYMRSKDIPTSTSTSIPISGSTAAAPHVQRTIYENENLNYRLLEINNTLTNISNTLFKPYMEKTVADIIKSILPPLAAILIFFWGLLNLRITESRAKMSFISPLINKSSDAITAAYTKKENSIPLNNGDITQIIEPIVQIKEFLNEDGLVELIVESNYQTFKLAMMNMPSNIITEVRGRNILNSYLTSAAGQLNVNNIQSILNDQYNAALSEVIEYKNKGVSLNTWIKRISIIVASISILSVYIYVSAV